VPGGISYVQIIFSMTLSDKATFLTGLHLHNYLQYFIPAV